MPLDYPPRLNGVLPATPGCKLNSLSGSLLLTISLMRSLTSERSGSSDNQLSTLIAREVIAA